VKGEDILPKYNIYKIIRSKLDEMISKFESVGLKKGLFTIVCDLSTILAIS